MKYFIALVLILITESAYSQKFFKPIPAVPQERANDTAAKKKQEWRPVVALPAIKLVETSREDAKVDALLLTSTGGGICYQWLRWDEEDKKWKSQISLSPATILLSGNVTADSPIDLSYAMTVGFFNNTIMLGGGYDLGSVSDRSRFFGVISIGISFNN
ncbi:MAG: hypothetical protein U0U09_18780 [Cyclobacteriaceae bacterium]